MALARGNSAAIRPHRAEGTRARARHARPGSERSALRVVRVGGRSRTVRTHSLARSGSRAIRVRSCARCRAATRSACARATSGRRRKLPASVSYCQNLVLVMRSRFGS